MVVPCSGDTGELCAVICQQKLSQSRGEGGQECLTIHFQLYNKVMSMSPYCCNSPEYAQSWLVLILRRQSPESPGMGSTNG